MSPETPEPPAVVPLPYDAAAVEKQLGPYWRDYLVRAYRWMTLARVLDARMLALQRQGRIGFYGPATGQEAVSVAAGLVSRPEDWIVPGLREQLVALVRGHSLERYMDHLFANDRDPARGRQMPCHPTAREVHYVSMSSVIGTQVSHGVGIGLAMQRRKEAAVALTFFGDGATSSNDFHAGMNFAGVYGLPVVFCCTNNQWAISVPVARQSHVEHLAQKATAYGIPGRTVDGTDLVAVLRDLGAALDHARNGGGPSMIEFVVYRMTPHSSSDDPTRYQSPDWMTEAQAHDPYRRLEELVDRLGLLSESDRRAMADDAEAEVKRAIAGAESVPAPRPESMTSDVWATPRGPVDHAPELA